MRPSLLALALSAFALGGVGGALALQQDVAPAPPAVSKAPVAPVTANLRPATEQEWIVEDVVTAIAGMVHPSQELSVDATPAAPADAAQSPSFALP